MALSIVIPCHGRDDLTARCIASWWTQRAASSLEFVVVDDGGTGSTAALGRRWPATQVVRREVPGGFAAAVNTGLAHAAGDVVLVVNNDTVAAPGSVAALLEAWRAAGPGAVVGPLADRVKGAQRDPDHAGDACPAALAITAARLARSPTITDVSDLSGLALLAARDTFTALGGFDERFGRGNWEDDDFCLRARLAGHRLVIARRAFLHHVGHATFDALGYDLRVELAAGAARFAAKWGGDPAGRIRLRLAAGGALPTTAELEAARARWPRWLDLDWLEARRALHDGDLEVARDALDRFLAVCPSHPLARAAREVTQDALRGIRHAG